MSIFAKKVIAVAAAAGFIFNISGCATYQMHPEFKERHKSIKSYALMPLGIEAYVLSFRGDRKMLADLIPIMEKTTREQLEKIMSEKGYILKKLALSEYVLGKDQELRTALFHINEVFDKQLRDIQKRKKTKFTYDVGSDANIFADRADCDLLVFVKEEGVKKSAGEIVKDIARGAVLTAACLLVGAIYVPIPRAAVTIVQIAVIDGNDGAIIWYNTNITAPDVDPENQKGISNLIKSLIKPFPDSIFKPKKSNAVLGEEKKALDVKTINIAPAGVPAR